jgi:hypothetical protein
MPAQVGWIAAELALGQADGGLIPAQFTEFRGPFDPHAFVCASRHVIARTAALRLVMSADRPGLAVMSPDTEFDLTVTRANNQAPDETIAALEHASELPLDIGRQSFAWELRQCGADHFIWSFRAHHFALDGTGRQLVAERVRRTYDAILERSPLPDWPDELDDLAREQRDLNTSADRSYWRDLIPCWPERTSLSARSPSPKRLQHRASQLISSVLLSEGLRRFGASRAQLLAVVAAADQARMCYTRDVLVGMTVSGRTSPLARRVPASLSNVLPLLVRFGSGGSVAPVLAATKLSNRSLIRHQHVRSEDIRRMAGLSPLDPNPYAVTVNVYPPDKVLSFGPSRVRTRVISNGPVGDLSLVSFEDRSEHVRIELAGNKDLYERRDLERHLSRIVGLLQDVCTGRDALFDVPHLGRRERALPDIRGAADARLVPDILAEAPRRWTSGEALEVGDERCPFLELDARSNRLARLLVAQGIAPDDVVAISLPRSIDFVVALLAVLKSGAACLPLDLNLPPARLHFVLANARPRLVVTDKDRSASVITLAGTLPTLCLDDPDTLLDLGACSAEALTSRDRIGTLRPANLAYVLYTSGSTGQPKGVEGTQAGLANRLAWIAQSYPFPPGGRLIARSAISFID